MAGLVSVDWKAVVAVGAVAAVGIWYAKRQAVNVAKAIDPTDQNNAANTYFNRLYSSVTGSDGTLGTDLAGWLHDPNK